MTDAADRSNKLRIDQILPDLAITRFDVNSA